MSLPRPALAALLCLGVASASVIEILPNGAVDTVLRDGGVAESASYALPYQEPCDSSANLPLPVKLARDGDLEGLHRLVEEPGRLTAVDDIGVDALMMASQVGRTAVVEWLLSTGQFDLDAIDKRGMSPAHFAASKGQHEALAVLLRAGANAAAEAGRGNGLVRAAIGSDCSECLRLLLDAGAPLADSYQGRSLVCLAAERDNLEALDALVRRGLPVDEPCTPSGQTPVSSAAVGGAMRTLRWLLDRNVAVDTRDVVGMTPLMFAASRGKFDAAAALLAAGADHSLTSQIKFSAARYARQNGFLETAVLIEDHVRTAEAQQRRMQAGTK